MYAVYRLGCWDEPGAGCSLHGLSIPGFPIGLLGKFGFEEPKGLSLNRWLKGKEKPPNGASPGNTKDFAMRGRPSSVKCRFTEVGVV